MIMTCKQLVSDLNKKACEPLSLKNRISMHLHLIMCSHCRAYKKQLTLLKVSFRKLLKLKANVSEEQLCLVENSVLNKLKSIDSKNDK